MQRRDGSLTLCIQHEAPKGEKRANDLDLLAALHSGSQQAARYGAMIRGLYSAFLGLNIL